MQHISTCGCCEGLSVETPVEIYNRPGLKAVAYRVGDHSTFKESLLTRLSSAGFPALRQLTTRNNDDFTIALLDAWATVSDVLTFYQERIANESYLGTATEQLSIVELARLIGYELRPGVAASTYLAFTVDETTMAAGQVFISGNTRSKEEPTPTLIAPGTKVQSIPGPGEEPQTFENIEPIEARAEWNAIKPRLGQPQEVPFEDDVKVIVVKGIDNNLKPGDVLLIKGKDKLKTKKLAKVVLDEETKTTALHLFESKSIGSSSTPKYQKFKTASSYIPTGNIKDYSQKVGLHQKIKIQDKETTLAQSIIERIWSEKDFTALLQMQRWSNTDLKESITKELAKQTPSDDVVFVFRKRAAVFGYNAPKYIDYYNDHGRLHETPRDYDDRWPIDTTDKNIYLDSAYEQVLPESYVAVQKPDGVINIYKAKEVDIRPHTSYGISGKSTVITTYENESWWDTSQGLSALRSITIHAQSEPLALAESPFENPISEDNTAITLSGLYLDLKEGRPVMLFGERTDLPGTHATELRVLKEVFIVGGFTVIVFDQPLAYKYKRETVTINANVALATHGETTKEVLGSGDATKTFQKFILKQPPLTFISAASPSGTQSTLEIRVNDLLWKEVPSLYERAPNEHIYITRQDDQGKTTVIFGDGKNGTRLPTGQENIRATYRKGIGVKGLVKANQLSQLISRPLGVKAVTNPVVSTGAQDREILADARRNATLTIFTLGRIVSLQDYEDFARAFAGISKALATWVWQRPKRHIHLTVAGYNGATVDKNSDLYKNLLQAIQDAGIPDVPVKINSYTPTFFNITANIAVHPDYLTAKVIAEVEQALRTHFSFEARQFGQRVAFSEIIAVIQNVAGVIAVDLDEPKDKTGQEPTGMIPSRLPRPGAEDTAPAELLTLHPGPIVLNLMP